MIMSAQEAKKIGTVNGIDVDALFAVVDDIKNEPAKGIVEFKVKTSWRGQARTDASVESYRLGGREIKRRFTIAADEPYELLGGNSAPNPQELLMADSARC